MLRLRTPGTAARALAAGLLTAFGCSSGPGPNPSPGAPSGEPSSTAVPAFPTANRPEVRGTHGAVVSDHPLASAAGLRVLQEGGSVVDAAVATAAVLAVVRPHMNGVGGDAFALIRDADSGDVWALNGSGRAGARATPDFFGGRIPEYGGASVSVPGAVAAWLDAHERFGRLPLPRLLAPAIEYARNGFPVTSRLGADFADQGGQLNAAGRDLYLPGGSPRAPGMRLANPALAGTLERIARDGRAGFYEGEVAETLARFVSESGGYLSAEDFATHTSTWVEPLRGEYLGHEFLVLPPNTQGIAQLQQMEMAKSFPFAEMDLNSSRYLHTLIELKKLAFADRDRWVADPEFEDLPVGELLDPAYLRARAGTVDPERAAREVGPGLGEPVPEVRDRSSFDDGGDTVYLTVVDAEGNAVSWIQSLYAGFGSGLLEPRTGVVLQNRGALFTLEPGHPNRVAPGKRPFHTLTPMMALHDGELAFTIGTPGGDSQTQSLLQITHDLLLFGMTEQEAVEAPRFRSYGGTEVRIEDRVSPAVIAQLRALGHEIRVVSGWTATFGGAQLIRFDPRSGALTAAADPRREAYAVAW